MVDRSDSQQSASVAGQPPAGNSAPVGKMDRDHTRQRIKELIDEGDGFWRACSGCQEGEDGYVSESDYPFDPLFRCQPGGGCSECGGIGVLWDDGRGYDDITADVEPTALVQPRTALPDGVRVMIEKLREVEALEDSNLRRAGYAVRKWAGEAATMIEALALQSPPAAKVEGIPADVAALVRRIGRAEWGSTPVHDAEGHGQHVANSVRLTAANFGQTEPQAMHGLYVEGTRTVICHTGTSPNSPDIGRALTGAWNWLHDQSVALQLAEQGDAAGEPTT